MASYGGKTKLVTLNIIDQIEIMEMLNQGRFVDLQDTCESPNLVGETLGAKGEMVHD